MIDREILQHILTSKLGATKDGNLYTLKGDETITVLVQQGEGSMQVQQIRSITFEDNYVALSSEEDVYFFQSGVILGIKASNPEVDRDEKRPGFRR